MIISLDNIFLSRAVFAKERDINCMDDHVNIARK